MIERKPEYYQDFHCIADQCNLTCCQEWKIAVDDHTQRKWVGKRPPMELMKKDKKHPICHEKLSEYITDKDDARVIKLDTDKKCPFLSEKKLCNLVIAYGDDILSETCAIFPRQVNTFIERDVKEYSLVACCPAVIDILKDREHWNMISSGDEKKQYQGYDVYEETLSDMRDQLIGLIQNKEFTLNEAMMSGFFFLLSALEVQDQETDRNADAEQIGNALSKKMEQLSQIKELDAVKDAIHNMDFSTVDTFYECNELLLDLAENYRKQDLYTAWLEPITKLAEQFSEETEDAKTEQLVKEFQQVSEEYEQLMRNYVVSEIFANLLLPEYDLENMVVTYQWIVMEYVTMRHTILLRWLVDGKRDIRYETMRDMMVIIARMMGYDEPDIREYMENSFEEVIWEWGYLALLCGD